MSPPLVRPSPATTGLRFCQNQQRCVQAWLMGQFQRAIVCRIDRMMQLNLLHECRLEDVMQVSAVNWLPCC